MRTPDVLGLVLTVILLCFSLRSLFSCCDSYEVIGNFFHIGLWILVFCNSFITLCFLVIFLDIFVFRSEIIKNYLAELLTVTISKLQNFNFDENSKIGRIIKVALSFLGDHPTESNRPTRRRRPVPNYEDLSLHEGNFSSGD